VFKDREVVAGTDAFTEFQRVMHWSWVETSFIALSGFKAGTSTLIEHCARFTLILTSNAFNFHSCRFLANVFCTWDCVKVTRLTDETFVTFWEWATSDIIVPIAYITFLSKGSWSFANLFHTWVGKHSSKTFTNEIFVTIWEWFSCRFVPSFACLTFLSWRS